MTAKNSKFDNDSFIGGLDDYAVNKMKYTKEQAIEIAKRELGWSSREYYLAIGEGFVRHRAGMNEDYEPCVGWWLEYEEHKTSCPAYVFHVIAPKNIEFCKEHHKEYEYVLVNAGSQKSN